jgi:hypothetical protein
LRKTDGYLHNCAQSGVLPLESHIQGLK